MFKFLVHVVLCMKSQPVQETNLQSSFFTEKEYNPKSTMKGDLLRARNLTRYINQLTKCKQYCEKRIYQQGGPDYKSYTTTSEEDRKMPGRRVCL